MGVSQASPEKQKAGQTAICRVGWQDGGPGDPVFRFEAGGSLPQDQEELRSQIELEVNLLKTSLWLGAGWSHPFALFWPSPGWMKPAYLTEGNLLYSKPSDLMLMSSKTPLQKHPE